MMRLKTFYKVQISTLYALFKNHLLRVWLLDLDLAVPLLSGFFSPSEGRPVLYDPVCI